MDRRELLYSLQFDDKLVLDDEVHAIAAVQSVSAVLQRQWYLSLIANAIPLQLETETFFISRFQQTRTELSMNSDRRANHPSGEASQLAVSASSAPLR